jgi:predicted RNA-binding protein YlxR (DUF448 family)
VVCRSEHSKRELVRIVRLPAGVSQSDGPLKGVALDVDSDPTGMGPTPHIQVDLTGKVAGRGAYLCKTGTCWDNAALMQKLSAALKTTLTAEDLAVLRAFRATIDD